MADSSAPSLRVLLTNLELWPRSGTVMYVRDLALALLRLGHAPAVFSSPNGAVADELRAAGIVVSDRLSDLERPDIIHGHHHAPTVVAVRRWPTVPAIHVCHDHLSPHDRTPLHERIRRHFGVSLLCVNRLVVEGVPVGRVALLPNFVDLARFSPRPRLPLRPRRALLFSNYADEESHLPAVREACLRAGLVLDVAGARVANVLDEPERVLGSYDIVFAKGRAAIEAMAVGCAVVLCDHAGVGPMVTSAKFEWLQARNFGFEALQQRLAPEHLVREIGRYDIHDAVRVRDLVRSRAGLEGTAQVLLGIYRRVLLQYRSENANREVRPREGTRLSQELFLRLYWAWASMPRERREMVKKIPGLPPIIAALRRLG